MIRPVNMIAHCATGVGVALAVIAGSGGPATAFTFENGTIWPLAVGINGGQLQIVDAETVAFLFRGECNNGCFLTIAIADPSQAQTSVRGANGQPPTIAGNGDPVSVRARMEGASISVEIDGGFAGTTPALPQPVVDGAIPPASPPLAPSASPAPALLPSDEQPPAQPPSGFIPPPPPPDYPGG